MDLLKEIEQQINSIKRSDNSSYLDSIFIHINRAEHYYKNGKEDSNFYNDVIYRSNQAYEGALKESYKVLAGMTPEEVLKKTPNDIERYFETNNVFRDRVLQLFKNYRQEWRNKSTHDYKLFFDESEAFIALMSVTSFVHLLLNQIQEKIAYLSQQKKLVEEEATVESFRSKVVSADKEPIDKLVDVIVEFGKQNGPYLLSHGQELVETEIMGLFHAYVETVGKTMHVQREPSLYNGDRGFRPDFLIELDNEKIILEFTRRRAILTNIQASKSQLLRYMEFAKTSKGIIYYAIFNKPNIMPEISKTEITSDGKKYEIVNIIS